MADPKGFLKIKRNQGKKRPPQNRIHDFKEHQIDLSKVEIKEQASRCMDCGVPFCMSNCSLGNHIPDFNNSLYKTRPKEALASLLATNNFPEFTGRVCPAPCESSCVLGLVDNPVTIKNNELNIIEQGFQEGYVHAQLPSLKTGKKVCIVGSGPAGLACAQQLNKAGHEVTIYEKADTPGGLLSWGIPEYKLPSAIVKRRIDLLKDEGIKFVLNCELGRDVNLNDLKTNADAVVLCLGAEVPNDLNLPGRNSKGIYFAMEFLSSQRNTLRNKWLLEEKNLNAKNKNVIVIGGGDTGSDCIGTAIRQGARSVSNFEILPKMPNYRSDNNPWPQDKRTYKISSSMEENIALKGLFEYQILTQRFLSNESNFLTGVETIHASKDEKTRKIWPCDLLLIAIGYSKPMNYETLKKYNLKLGASGLVALDPTTKMTSLEGVFAAGDCSFGQSLVVTAIAEGRDTASCVDKWLMKKESLLPRPSSNC
ncbi:MAG: glutamate synthase [Zetaproteobacteria bacterium]|nr:glutamate synthase [Pseudobdellovibrionaceae bacterium]